MDKTHNNINRVDEIINELEVQVGPLEEQKDKALEYKKISSELEGIEVSLIAHDITNINFEYQKNKNRIIELEDEISKLSTNNSFGESKVLDFKNKLSNLELEIKTYQDKLLNLTKQVEQLNSRKTIILERQKYTVEDSKLMNII